MTDSITNNFPPNDSHFTSEDRKAIYRLEFNHEATQKDIKEIKNDVREIKDGISARVSVLELAKVSSDAALKNVDDSSTARFKENRGIIDDHESRIRSVEKSRDTLNGKIWGIGSVITAAGTILAIIINHFWK